MFAYDPSLTDAVIVVAFMVVGLAWWLLPIGDDE